MDLLLRVEGTNCEICNISRWILPDLEDFHAERSGTHIWIVMAPTFNAIGKDEYCLETRSSTEQARKSTFYVDVKKRNSSICYSLILRSFE